MMKCMDLLVINHNEIDAFTPTIDLNLHTSFVSEASSSCTTMLFSEAISLRSFILLSKFGCLVDSFCIICSNPIQLYYG